jgi:hypothetical protein
MHACIARPPRIARVPLMACSQEGSPGTRGNCAASPANVQLWPQPWLGHAPQPWPSHAPQPWPSHAPRSCQVALLAHMQDRVLQIYKCTIHVNQPVGHAVYQQADGRIGGQAWQPGSRLARATNSHMTIVNLALTLRSLKPGAALFSACLASAHPSWSSTPADVPGAAAGCVGEPDVGPAA